MGWLPAWLNPFDVMIALALIVGVVYGFVRGLVRMVLSLVVVYLATVLAMTFYEPVGERIYYLAQGNIPDSGSQTLAFLIILILTAVIVNFGLSRAFKDTELPGIRQIDQLGGLVVGFFLVATWIGLVLVGFVFVLTTEGAGSDAFQGNLLTYLRGSKLVPVFYRFLPIVLATLKPWLPKGELPAIFTFRL